MASVIATGTNSVTSSNDPTAHAEVTAIREACRALGTFQLTGCEIYTSCEPCPMCLGAIYWARPDRVYFAATASDAAEAGFDDSFIYEELKRAHRERKIPFEPMMREAGLEPFREWARKERPDPVLKIGNGRRDAKFFSRGPLCSARLQAGILPHASLCDASRFARLKAGAT